MLPSKSRKLADITNNREPGEEAAAYDLESLRDSLWPVSNPDFVETNPLLGGGLCSTGLKFYNKLSEHPADVNNLSKPVIEIGTSFDIISLLSFNGSRNYLLRNNGDRVLLSERTFRSKDVMVCCFPVPMFHQHDNSLFCQSLATICHDNYDNHSSKFEMVVVAKMNPLADHRSFFDHFMSAFPSSCLLVPFDDIKGRDYICNYLDVSRSCKCFIVDRSGTVLFNNFPNFAVYNGLEAFPYTPEILLECDAADTPLCESPSTIHLEQLLGCTASDVLDKINLDGSRQQVSISELKQKVVGLFLLYEGSFLFGEGNFIFTLHKVYEQCKAQRLDFEIVVVYLPFGDCLDPESFQVVADAFMMRHQISWWRMPFDNTKCRRLWRLCSFSADKLIILGPNSQFADPYGRDVITNYGFDAYPFTRESLVQILHKKFRALTLQSLLAFWPRNHVLRGNDPVAVPALQPKSVLVYFALNFELVDELQTWYAMIKEVDPNFEVIVVPQNNTDVDMDSSEQVTDEELSQLSWLICPFNSDHSASLEKKLFQNCAPCDTIIGFGIDGHVCSIQALELLQLHGPDCLPFVDILRNEVIARLDHIHTFMEDMK